MVQNDTLIIKCALSFESFVDGIDFSKYELCKIIVNDETAVFMGNASYNQTKSTIKVPQNYDYTQKSALVHFSLLKLI